MRTKGKPGLWLGLLRGLILPLPLVALFYLGYRLAALPFPPFNLFDWQTRILAGSVLGKGLQTTVRVIWWTPATGTSPVPQMARHAVPVPQFIPPPMPILTPLPTLFSFS